MTNIPLSREHGIAPALMVCPICGEGTNGIALLGKHADKIPDFGFGTKIVDSEPCEKCKAYLDLGATAFLEYIEDEKRINRAFMIGAEASARVFEPESRGKMYWLSTEKFNKVCSDLGVDLSENTDNR